MPEDRAPDRDAKRIADQAGIDRLIDALVPALVAKLGTLNVGELEVREGDWKVRLRRPAGSGSAYERRSSDRAGMRLPGHDAVGAPATTRGASAGTPSHASNGSGGPTLAPVGPGRSVDAEGRADADAERADGDPTAPVRGQIATSPAVGTFQPGPAAVSGTRVRAGDRLGVVDMLGIPQDVLAPADGIVVGVMVEAGTSVEYGQDLVHMEAAGAVEAR